MLCVQPVCKPTNETPPSVRLGINKEKEEEQEEDEEDTSRSLERLCGTKFKKWYW